MKAGLAMLAGACSALLASCAAQQEQSDWERRNASLVGPAEEAIELPPFPTGGNLIEFPVSAARGFRFYIDGDSVSVGRDGIVRYVLVARSVSGNAENVSYEGMRCRSAEHKRYAVGRADGTWAEAASAWRTHAPWHRELQREYFCPQTQPIGSAEEGVRALRGGSHPFSRGLASPPMGR